MLCYLIAVAVSGYGKMKFGRAIWQAIQQCLAIAHAQKRLLWASGKKIRLLNDGSVTITT